MSLILSDTHKKRVTYSFFELRIPKILKTHFYKEKKENIKGEKLMVYGIRTQF